MRHDFHNTVDLQGDELEKAEVKAKFQNVIVMEFFESRPYTHMTPTYVYERLIKEGKLNKKVPKTSIRRALSDLSKDGKLRKSENKVPGPLGMVEHEWVYEPETID